MLEAKKQPRFSTATLPSMCMVYQPLYFVCVVLLNPYNRLYTQLLFYRQENFSCERTVRKLVQVTPLEHGRLGAQERMLPMTRLHAAS